MMNLKGYQAGLLNCFTGVSLRCFSKKKKTFIGRKMAFANEYWELGSAMASLVKFLEGAL